MIVNLNSNLKIIYSQTIQFTKYFCVDLFNMHIALKLNYMENLNEYFIKVYILLENDFTFI